MSFVIRSNGGIESEPKKQPERLQRTSWRRLGGPGKLRGDVWRLWRRFLVFRGCLRETLGSSWGAPGCLGVLRGALGEAFGTFGALRGGVGSGNGVNVEIMELLKF